MIGYEKGTSLRLIITPPFWMTTWFRLLFGVTLIAGLVAVYKIRISMLEKEKKTQQVFSRKLIEEVEKGRKSIAGELHDSLGQNLLIIKNEIQQMITELSTKKQTNDDLNDISTLVSESINEVRQISTDLHPHQLDRLGLKKAIESVIQKFAHSSVIELITEIEEIDDIFPENLEIHVFRIIQEGLSNIMKHAEATVAHININKKKKYVYILIKDNGKGFYFKSYNSKKDENQGFGLASMAERVKILKGKLVIDSSSDKGTEIRIRIPLN